METNNPRSCKIKCLQTGEVFDTMTKAEDWCGLSKCSISRYLITPERKSCGKHPTTKQPLTWERIYEQE